MTKTQMPALEFGEFYTITGTLKKHRPKHNVCNWQRKPSEPVRALYVGRRYLPIGVAGDDGSWWYDEDGGHWEAAFTFDRQGTQPAYLFILNERQNPVYVAPEDVVTAEAVTA